MSSKNTKTGSKLFPNLKSLIASKFRNFSKHSTLHGFYYFYKSSSRTVHLFWFTIILSSFIVCTFLSNRIWQKYLSDPTFTVVESTHFPIAEIPFPSVAVCDSQIVYGPRTTDITNILGSHGYNMEQIDAFYRSLSAVRERDYIPPAFVPRMHLLLEDLGLSISDLIDMLKKPCEDLMVSCVWRSKAHNCSNMFRSIITFIGHCCQFDVQYFQSEVKDSNISFVAGIDAVQGLQVIVNEQNISANGTVSNGLVLLYIYDSKDSLTILDNPARLSAGAYYDIDVEVWAIDSSDNVRTLPVDTRKCLLKTDKQHGADFYQGCVSMLILKEVALRCRCLPFNKTAAELKVDYLVSCNWQLLFCVFQTIDKKMHDLSRLADDSSCYERCDFVQYDTELRYIREDRMNRHTNPYHARFAVHFADNTCMKYKRQVIFTWDQMWANLGGIYGLCLGGSIISIIELIWFIADLVYTIILQAMTKKISLKKHTQKVFSINAHEREYNNKRLAFVD